MIKGGWRLFCGGCIATLAMLSLPALALAGKVTDNARDASKTLEEGKLTLAKIIEAAQADTKGKALGVTAEKGAAGAEFVVHCHAGDKCFLARLDKSGKVTRKDPAKPEDCKSCADAAKMMDTGKLTLASAVTAAETDTKGKATAVTADGKGFQVAVVTADNKIWTVTVGPDGKVAKKDELKPVQGG
jgi:uncharacterized membrane protein YkoI